MPWVSELGPGPNRDQAAHSLAFNLSGTEPEIAFDWAMSIGESELRSKAVDEVAQHWIRAHPADARAQIQFADIPELQRTQLLKQADDQLKATAGE